MNQVKNIKTFIGSTLWTEEEKRDQLLNGDEYIGCKHGNDILYKENGSIKSIDAQHIPIENFINRASVSTNISQLSDYLEKFGGLQKYKNYSFVSLNQGDNITIDYHGTDNIIAFTATDKGNGNYFDFVLYHLTSTIASCDYSNKQIPGYKHSGDNMSGKCLLHYICSSTNKNKKVCALGVVGYRRKELRTFVEQNPSIVVVDETSEILYVIPCPLDVATVEDGTFATLATIQRIDNKLNFSILRKPIVINNVDTGCTNNEVKKVVNATIVEHCTDNVRASVVTRSEIKRIHTDLDLPETLHFIQKGVNTEYDDKCFVFGRGLTWSDMYMPTDPDVITLSPFGILRGPALISLQQAYIGTIDMDEVTFLSALDRVTIVIEINDKWLESAVKINDVLINACIILHIPVTTDVLQAMKKVCISGVSAIAGPLATIIVCCDEKYYWYRGIADYGAPENATFGQDITDTVDFVKRGTCANVYYRDEEIVEWNNEMTDIVIAKNDILAMTCDNIVENISNIKTLFTQLQIIYDSRQLNKIIQEISLFLQQKIDQASQEKTEHIDVNNLSETELLKHIANSKGDRRKIQRTLKPLIQHIASLISFQKSANKTCDLKQLQRKAVISDNIGKATSMNTEERLELLSLYSDTILFMKLNIPEFKLLVNNFRNMNDSLVHDVNFPNNNILTINNDLKKIDFDTTTDLAQVSRQNDHELKSGNSIAININENNTYIPFMINNSMIECKDPSSIFWVDECNKEEWSIYRIVLRGTIAHSKTGKANKIASQDKQVGYMIVNMIITAIENISMSMDTESINFNDDNCKIVRGLFGVLLTTLSAGANPMSMAWQLVMKNPKMDNPKNDVWIYLKIMQQFKFTGWDEKYVINNTKKLLMKIIKNKICGPAIKAMQEQISKAKGDSQEAYVKSRNNELKHCRIMSDFIIHCIDNDIELTSESAISMAKKAIELYDNDPTEIINMQPTSDHLIDAVRNISKGKFNIVKQDNLYKIVIKMYTKRSACFSDIKRNILNALMDGNNINETINTFKEMKHDIEVDFSNNARVQNESAITSMDISKLQGDAELKRLPWQLINEDTQYEDNISYVLGSVPSKNKSSDALSSDNLIKHAKGFLEDVRGSNLAISLHTNAKTNIVSVIEKYMSFTDMQIMLDFIDVGDHYQCLFDVIEEALRNYDDGNNCENCIMTTLYKWITPGSMVV